MDEITIQCIKTRAKNIQEILQDVKKCETWAMRQNGYKEIEMLANGIEKMIERKEKEATK